MVRVISVPLREDLTGFTQFLWKNEIPHRVLENEYSQELWVPRTVDPDKIYAIYEIWQQGGNLDEVTVVHHQPAHVTSDLSSLLKNAWLSVLLIVVSTVLTLAIGFGDNFELLRYLTIADVVLKGNAFYTSGLEATFESFELWRLISPMFIHFSLPHIIFNVLWIWVVGTRIEIALGRGPLLGLVLFSAIISNLAQYWVAGPMFGGLSGVVFAFLGFAWLWDKMVSHIPIGLPPSIMSFLLLWLVLGYTGVLEALGLGTIANTAHLAGMLAGLIFVPVAKFWAVRVAKRR